MRHAKYTVPHIRHECSGIIIFFAWLCLLSGPAFSGLPTGTAWPQSIKPSEYIENMISPDDIKSGDNFGWSVAIYGDTALVGAPQQNSAAGAAYVFIRSGTTWTLQQKLLGANTTKEQFGWSVALDGDTVLVGALGTASISPTSEIPSAVYVFTRLGTTWTLQQKLPHLPAKADGFGWAVALSGDTALVGTPWKGSAKELYGVGAAYVFTRSGITWTQQQLLNFKDGKQGDKFGGSVAISGDTAIVGAAGRGPNASGAAYIFTRSGTTWSQQKMLALIDGKAGDGFGSAVALSGETALVGAQGRGAYLYVRSGSDWSQQEIFSNISDEQNFGGSVALSGDIAMVGAPDSSVHAYSRSEKGWSEYQIITPSDGGGMYYFYGISVAIDPTQRAGKDTWVGAPGGNLTYIYADIPSNTGRDGAPFREFKINYSTYVANHIYFKSTVVLAKSSNGLSPSDEPLAFKVGDFATIIPAGSFSKVDARRYFYAGQIGDLWVTAYIRRTNQKRYVIELWESGSGINQDKPLRVVPIDLMIGDDHGKTIMKY